MKEQYRKEIAWWFAELGSESDVDNYLALFPELNSRLSKFAVGILKWEIAGLIDINNTDDVSRVRLILKVLDTTLSFDFFDNTFNDATPEMVCEIIGMTPMAPFEESIIGFNYSVDYIGSYAKARQLYMTSWCIVISEEFCLLSLRKDMINKRVLAHQEEILPDIIAFNDALRDALKEMYDRAHCIWDSIKENAWGDDVEVTAKCFLSYDYPGLHPLQGEERGELWGAICDSGWNPLYDDGVTLPTLTLPRDINEDFDTFIGVDCPPPNWNEGLDRELTKDLHLHSAFHNLFDHMNFSITDFIYVRKFETEINIEINKMV